MGRRAGSGWRWGVLGGCCCVAMSALAEESAVQWHGFASQALVYADRHRLGEANPQQLGSYLREAGLNVSWQPDASWLLSAQVLSRRDGILSAKPRLDVLMLEHSLLDRDGQLVALQVGMLKNPYGFYNLTRDVAHARPGIVLPGVYHDQSRNFFLSAPALAARGQHQGAGGVLSWQFNVLHPDVNNPCMVMFLVGEQQRGQFQARRSAVGQLMWESAAGDWRAAWSFTDMSMHYQPLATDFGGAGAFTGAGDLTLRSHLLSLEHNSERWTHTLEYAQARILRDHFNIPGAAFMDQHSTLEQGYVQSAYRLDSRWQAWLRHDWMFVNKQDRNGLAFATLTGLSPYQRYVRDWGLGLRYDPTPNWTWMAEVHHVNGTASLSLFGNPTATHRPVWSMLLLQAAYHF